MVIKYEDDGGLRTKSSVALHNMEPSLPIVEVLEALVSQGGQLQETLDRVQSKLERVEQTLLSMATAGEEQQKQITALAVRCVRRHGMG